MSQEAAASPPRADSSAKSGIHPTPAASFSSTGSCSDGGGVEEYCSFDDFYEELVLDLICGDWEEDEIDGLVKDSLLRAGDARRAQLRLAAALREEDRVAAEALRRQMAAQGKATRDRIKALRRKAARKRDEERRRLAARNDEGLRRLTEYTDLLEADVSRYTEAQLAEYKRDLDRRSRELFGGGGGA